MMTEDLLGVQFLENGQDPAVGLGCWGLAKELCRRNGTPLPDAFEGLSQEEVAKLQEGQDPVEWISNRFRDWRRVEEPKVGCVLAFGQVDGAAVHVGVVVEEGKFMHTTRGAGRPSIVRLSREPWASKLIGVYEHRTG